MVTQHPFIFCTSWCLGFCATCIIYNFQQHLPFVFLTIYRPPTSHVQCKSDKQGTKKGIIKNQLVSYFETVLTGSV